jgi:PKD repeat protein
LVKKPSEIINIELISHPAQTASAWDNVEMKINVNGTPSTVIWDFWDGKTHECKERNCLNITHIFEEKWNYNISVKVSYPDRPTIEWTINLIVRNK